MCFSGTPKLAADFRDQAHRQRGYAQLRAHLPATHLVSKNAAVDPVFGRVLRLWHSPIKQKLHPRHLVRLEVVAEHGLRKRGREWFECGVR